MMPTAICGRRAAFSSSPATSIFPRRSRRLRTASHVIPVSYLAFPQASSISYAQLRPARSSSRLPILSTRSYSSTSAQASSREISQAINPPPTTRPAILDLPSSKETPDLSSKFTHYISIGRAYFAFYKTGLKNVYYNYRSSIPLRKSLNLPLYIPTSPPSNNKKANSSLSRSDFQLLRRSAYDVRRMIPFTLILIICGEFTPLVVLALGNAICPLTCRVPKQLEKGRIKRMGRKTMVTSGLLRGKKAGASMSEKEDLEMLMGYADPKKVDKLKGKDVAAAAALFDLSLGFLPSGGLLEGVNKGRVKGWVEYLVADDKLIVKGGGVERLGQEEVRIAVEERGGVGVGMGLGEKREVVAEREWLKRWIEGRVKDGVV